MSNLQNTSNRQRNLAFHYDAQDQFINTLGSLRQSKEQLRLKIQELQAIIQESENIRVETELLRIAINSFAEKLGLDPIRENDKLS